jgi:type II secretion system protein L
MLVIRLQTPTDTEPAWAVLNGTQPADWQHGAWNHLMPLIRTQPVVLLIPSREVLLTRTTINTRNQKQLKQALPYALEDSLADDPDSQHIVWQAQADSTQVDVAVIDREQLRRWVATLQSHHIRPQTILPDIFALPWQDGSVTLWQQGEQVWVRTGELSGYASSSHALPLLLDSLTAENKPLSLRFFSDQTAEPAAASTPAVDWANDTRLHLIPETHAEQLLQASLEPAFKLNLLSGLQDESSQQFRQQWQRWRNAAGLAGACLVLAGGLYGVESFRLQKQLDQLDSENQQLFTELFPDAGTIDPRSLKNRLASELAGLKGKAGAADGDSPLPHLAKFAAALAQTQGGIQVEEIRSDNASVAIELQAKDQQAIETLRESLEKTIGNPIEMQSSRTADTVKASLTLGSKS